MNPILFVDLVELGSTTSYLHYHSITDSFTLNIESSLIRSTLFILQTSQLFTMNNLHW